MTDRPSIVSLVLLLLASGCGTSTPNDTAATSQPGSSAANPSLVAVSSLEQAPELRQPPSAVRAVADLTFERVVSRQQPSALDARQLPSDADPTQHSLPPSIDWGAMAGEGLLLPPSDRPATDGYNLIDAPLPGEASLAHSDATDIDSAESSIAETIGALARRPAIHAAPRPSPASPAQQDAIQDSLPETRDDREVQTLTGPRDWLAAADEPSTRRFSLDRKVKATSAEAVAERNDEFDQALDMAALDAAASEPPTAHDELPPDLANALDDNQPAPMRAARPARTMPLPLTQTQRAEMLAVARLADAHSKRGFELAGRNALYSSRAEFIQALGMVAQGLDAIERGTARVDAMTAGLKALEESDHFVSNSSQIATDFDAVVVARPHHTPVLQNREPGTTSAMQALQLYYGYAQRQLEFAAGRQPAASMSLHGLGKVHSALAKTKRPRASAAEPKAIVFFQAALLADPRNFMAANELGVLLANYGKYPQAKAAFVQSLRVSGQPVTWRNLAIVHGHLGEKHLAQLALQEAKFAAQRGVDQQLGPLGLSGRAFDVQWVDAQTLAQVNESSATAIKKPGDTPPPPVTAMPPRSPMNSQR